MKEFKLKLIPSPYQAMVEFETMESASKARTSLHGCDIYNNCCTMKVGDRLMMMM